MSSLTLDAPAKVNLYLRVLGRREDGYHVLDSLFHTVGLYDRITLSASASGPTLTCSDPSLAGPGNLALSAAHHLADAAGRAPDVDIHLEKAIPTGAGLGGGSSDAATVLTGLNRLWGLGWPRERLAEIGAALGSDVPFFVYGGAAVIGGRGEFVTPVPDMAGRWCVLLNPGVGVSTAAVFSAYARESTAELLTERRSAPIITPASTVPGTIPEGDWMNDLEPVACRMVPEVGHALDALRNAGGKGARMSGSGTTVFCLAPTREAADGVRERLAAAPGWNVWVVPLTAAEAAVPVHD